KARAARRAAGLVPALTPNALRHLFQEGLDHLRARYSGRDRLYLQPWYLNLGEAFSGKSAMLAGTGLQAHVMGDQNLSWWFCDEGAVLDLNGQILLRQDTLGADDKSWQTLLQLLNRHRAK